MNNVTDLFKDLKTFKSHTQFQKKTTVKFMEIFVEKNNLKNVQDKKNKDIHKIRTVFQKIELKCWWSSC